MAVKLRKPILVGGIGLSFLLWLWNSFQESVGEMGELSLVGVIAFGGGLWFLQRKVNKHELFSEKPISIDRKTAEKAIASAEIMINSLEIAAPEADISDLKQQLLELPKLFDRETLKIALTGGRKVGKTQLKQILERETIRQNSQLIETEALFSLDNEAIISVQENIVISDLVLLITNGDLTDSEWQILQQLIALHQRLLLIFNKQDQYLPEEQSIILQQLQQRVKNIIPEEDVIAISAAPQNLKVRKYQENGEIREWLEKPQPELGKLSDRLRQILEQEREQLVIATTWREAEELKKKTKHRLNEIRKKQAIPIIEQYQWIAAATALANPVAALDLLATAAVSGQMLIDLSEIYQQKISLSQAQTAAGTIGKLMVQLGLVEVSTQTIGSMLKSNAITYVAGGAVQAVSAAYLTRLAGLSLIEYFQEQEIGVDSEKGLNLARLREKLTQILQQNQRTAFLRDFAKQAMVRLAPELPPLNS